MTEQRIDDLEARLRRLEDIDAIKRLRMQYHVNINSDRFEEMADIFSEDGIVDFGEIGQAQGRDDIRDLYMQIPKQTDYVKQYIHNHMIDVDGDDAKGISFLDARYAHKGEGLMVAAAFHEKYRRTAEGWRISHMRLELWFTTPVQKGWGDMVRGSDVGSGSITPFR